MSDSQGLIAIPSFGGVSICCCIVYREIFILVLPRERPMRAVELQLVAPNRSLAHKAIVDRRLGRNL